MDILERLKLRTGATDEAVLLDCLETAKNAILSRRFPYGKWPTQDIIEIITTTDAETGEEVEIEEVVGSETYVEDCYLDLQFRIAMDLYNKIGAEGQNAHSENGISRTYESSWISKQLLNEITPYVGIPQ